MDTICTFCCNPNWVDILTLIVAVIGIIIAVYELNRANKINAADFTHKFDNDFYIEKHWIVIKLISLDLLEQFVDNENSDDYFKLKKEKIENLPERYFDLKEYAKIRNYEITNYEIDDYLGQFERIGLYEKNKILRIEYIYEMFDTYIQEAYDNNIIKEYLNSYEKDGNEEIYFNFKQIVEKCNHFSKNK